MKYLLTGVSGFVARHMIDHISSQDPSPAILGVDMAEPPYRFPYEFSKVNLLDQDKLREEIGRFRPDRIVHLASFSSVGRSWEQPALCFSNNTNIFLNLLDAVRASSLSPRILSVGSSEEYGAVDEGDLPLSEASRLNPISPYAVARVAQEQLSVIYAKSFGLDIVITRSFNHVGVGQEPIFAIPSIAKQFAEAPNGGMVELHVGDASIIRDFLDVRDVARAYSLLLVKGMRGEIYNVCGGMGYSIEAIIKMLAEISGKRYTLIVDPARVRPSDNRKIIGDHSKLTELTGWKPSIRIEESLHSIYEHFREKASQSD